MSLPTSTANFIRSGGYNNCMPPNDSFAEGESPGANTPSGHRPPITPTVGVDNPLAVVANYSFRPDLRAMARNHIREEELHQHERNLPGKRQKVSRLLENNAAWAAAIKEQDPDFFTELAKAQNPQYLWIGCSDSRVPANQVVGLAPGEVFVHRNIANVVPRSDLNSLSCLSFAVNQLKVNHVIVCGHHGCGGVKAALHKLRLGLVDNWIMHIVDVKNKYASLLDQIESEEMQFMALCELNVLSQLCNVAETHVLQDVWKQRDSERSMVQAHGWVYDLDKGHVHQLLTLKRDSDVRMEVECAALEIVKRFMYRARGLDNMVASSSRRDYPRCSSMPASSFACSAREAVAEKSGRPPVMPSAQQHQQVFPNQPQ